MRVAPTSARFGLRGTSQTTSSIVLRHVGIRIMAVIILEPSSLDQSLLLTYLYYTREDEDVGQLFETVVLQCENGDCLPAHKSVLAVGSDYFRAMFTHTGNIENETNFASFPDTSAEVMNIIIKYLYRQKLPTQHEITDTLMRETLITSDKMQLKGLFDVYWKLYSTPITLVNFLNIWEYADMFFQAGTLENIRMFVVENSEQISKSDILADVTEGQLQSIIDCNLDKLESDKLGNFINFLLSWGWKGKNRMTCVWMFLAKCDISKLSDFLLWKLISSNQTVIKFPAIYNVLSKQVTSRWLRAVEPRFQIHAFKKSAGKTWKHSITYLNNERWNTNTKEKKRRDCFPALSGTGSLFNYKINKHNLFGHQFTVYDSSGNLFFMSEEFTFDINNIESETANRKEIFFRSSPFTYLCFNTENKELFRVSTTGTHYCRSMLLATDEKYFFDLNDRCIQIVNRKSGACRIMKKLPGNWKSVKCKFLEEGPATKLIFFQKSPISCLLIYDIGKSSWSNVFTPNITGEVVFLIYFDGDCLIFEKSNVTCN
uniref:BTB domain-containing protein n=1 Tax=Strigamia maritima TaxID=126957 RepID=T1J069_STRMM